jgi:23S rRNA (guanine2069-N7)-methyltransferase / 23S rRNA (guanine2445-N2)-methyltransferase
VSAVTLTCIASAPRGFADLLSRELNALGALQVRERAGGVAFSGPLETVYAACLWSRIANRVFLEVAQFQAADVAGFYAAVRAVDWAAHLGPEATLACDFTGRHPAITHTHFGALKLKDGIVDALREARGTRPDIAPDRPHVRVHAHAHGTAMTVSIDLSGESLHRRGYRGAAGEAPLKENVAAGVLLRAGWAEHAAQGAPFVDPLTGSGTFCIEAAMIAADRAPGLTRDYFGFVGWGGHDRALWEKVQGEARQRAQAGTAAMRSLIQGSDRDARAVASARDNARRAGLEQQVHFDVRPLADAAPPAAAGDTAGLVCANPPYGVRLEEHEGARLIHAELGAVLRERFQGWDAAVLTGAPELGKELGLRAYRTHAVWNGGIECRLLRIRIGAQSERVPGTLGKGITHLKDTPGARMFGNRLGKNLKRLGTWARRSDVSCWRMYDADMPEYAFAIDLYRDAQSGEPWLYVQEYAAPAEIELEAARRRRGEVLATLPDVTGVPAERIRVRTRRRSRHGAQYEKLDEQQHFHTVMEGGLRFRVNFEDYLDTGLFLDHRITRARLRDAARGRRFLNLFGYTGTATVYAAAGGAAATTTIDMSRPYLEWAQRNLALNALSGPAHTYVQADCLAWLAQEERGGPRFDLIFLDPPTFSNSSRMEGVLDLQRDHDTLIRSCMKLLEPGGMLLFSTNAQRFRLEEGLSAAYDMRDVSAATLPKDFERNPRIHRCYEVRLRA